VRTVQAFTAGDTIPAAGSVDPGTARARAGPASAPALQRAARPYRSRASRRTAAPGAPGDRGGGVSDPLALAMLLRGSGTGYLQ
jgi:hypothetical protein